MIESKQKNYKSIRNLFLERLDFYTNQSNHSLILSHFGEFRLQFIRALTNQFSNYLNDHNFSKNLQKKMYSILNEGMQNIYIHGKLDAQGKKIACLYIRKTKDEFIIDFGNLIRPNEMEDLINYMDRLNQLNNSELENLYQQTLTNGYLTKIDGGGIGLLLMRIKSKNKIHYTFSELNDAVVLFNFTIHIAKDI